MPTCPRCRAHITSLGEEHDCSFDPPGPEDFGGTDEGSHYAAPAAWAELRREMAERKRTPSEPSRDAHRPREHDLKTWPAPFGAVLDGTKTFELRRNDRDFRVGDRLILREWDPDRESHTGRRCTRRVTYVTDAAAFGCLRDGFGCLRDGFVCLGLAADGEHEPQPRLEQGESPKQWIILRRDLPMRKGKMVSQGGHGVIRVLLEQMVRGPEKGRYTLWASDVLEAWIEGLFTKICLSAKSEAELLDIYAKARAAGVLCTLITDAGLTEFGGVPTHTCVVIGPALPGKVEHITGGLPLL